MNHSLNDDRKLKYEERNYLYTEKIKYSHNYLIYYINVSRTSNNISGSVGSMYN